MNKLREALEEADIVLSALGYDANTPIRTQIKQALSEPLKNCEVGTVREQDARFDEFCCSNNECDKCPLKKEVVTCALGWAHMPYEEEGE